MILLNSYVFISLFNIQTECQRMESEKWCSGDFGYYGSHISNCYIPVHSCVHLVRDSSSTGSFQPVENANQKSKDITENTVVLKTRQETNISKNSNFL